VVFDAVATTMQEVMFPDRSFSVLGSINIARLLERVPFPIPEEVLRMGKRRGLAEHDRFSTWLGSGSRNVGYDDPWLGHQEVDRHGRV
jgi:hypothetical protein